MFDRIAFDRTFRSFLPLSVRVERGERAADRAARATAARRLHQRSPRTKSCRPTRGSSIVQRRVDYAFITGEQRPVLARTWRYGQSRRPCRSERSRLRVLRDVSHSQLARLWTNSIFGRVKQRWLADVATRFGAWFTVGGDRACDRRRSRLVARRCGQRERRNRRADRGVSVRADALGADHARHGDGRAGPARAVPEACRGRARSEPHRHGDLRQDRHPDRRRPNGLSRAAMASASRAGRSFGGSHASPLHPISRAIAAQIDAPSSALSAATDVREVPGQGIAGTVAACAWRSDRHAFVARSHGAAVRAASDDRTCVAAGSEIGWVRVSRSRPRAGIARSGRRGWQPRTTSACSRATTRSSRRAGAPLFGRAHALPAVAGGQARVREPARRPRAGAC